MLSQSEKPHSDLLEGASAVLMGGGIVILALFPLAIPALALLALAAIPLVALALAGALIAGLVLLPVRLIRLANGARRRRVAGEPAPSRAASAPAWLLRHREVTR
jgi:hypothetical protein